MFSHVKLANHPYFSLSSLLCFLHLMSHTLDVVASAYCASPCMSPIIAAWSCIALCRSTIVRIDIVKWFSCTLKQFSKPWCAQDYWWPCAIERSHCKTMFPEVLFFFQLPCVKVGVNHDLPRSKSHWPLSGWR